MVQGRGLKNFRGEADPPVPTFAPMRGEVPNAAAVLQLPKNNVIFLGRFLCFAILLKNNIFYCKVC